MRTSFLPQISLPGTLTQPTSYQVVFQSPGLEHESYQGSAVQVLYQLRVRIALRVGCASLVRRPRGPRPRAQQGLTRSTASSPPHPSTVREPQSPSPPEPIEWRGGICQIAQHAARRLCPTPPPRSCRARIERKLPFWVRRFEVVPEATKPLKMEVGIEDCLHLEFEYTKNRFHLSDVVVGRIHFQLVRIALKSMEIEIKRRETVGSGPNAYNDSQVTDWRSRASLPATPPGNGHRARGRATVTHILRTPTRLRRAGDGAVFHHGRCPRSWGDRSDTALPGAVPALSHVRQRQQSFQRFLLFESRAHRRGGPALLQAAGDLPPQVPGSQRVVSIQRALPACPVCRCVSMSRMPVCEPLHAFRVPERG